MNFNNPKTEQWMIKNAVLNDSIPKCEWVDPYNTGSPDSQPMRTIMIEEVRNGFIVRPFQPCETWATTEHNEMWVFRTLSELASHLEDIFQFNGGEKPFPKSDTFGAKEGSPE